MTTTYTFDNLIADVTKEATALRVHATEEERGRLKIGLFNPKTGSGCIYGLLCEYCHSERAVELIQLCCVRYFKGDNLLSIASYGFSTVEENVVMGPIENLFEFRGERSGQLRPKYFSAIEAYILLPEAKNANLISYLRGETETLDL